MKKKKDVKPDEISTLKDQLVRALADYDNLRKRYDRERENLKVLAGYGIITKLLPVLDMLESAQEHLQDSGLAIAIIEFKSVLEDEGVEAISAKIGEEFNEECHEAIEVVEGDDGKIIEVSMTGWKFTEGPVIRPAKVKVGKALKSENVTDETN